MGERVARLVRSANIFAAMKNIFAADVSAEQPGRHGHAAGPGGGGGAPAAAAAPLAAGPGRRPAVDAGHPRYDPAE